MLTAYTAQNGQAIETDFSQKNFSCFWIDLLNPSHEEISLVENQLKLHLPIENIKDGSIKNRFFQDHNAYFLTALVSEEKNILFYLKDQILITIRTIDILLPPSDITTAKSLLSFFINKFTQEIADSLEHQERLLLQASETINNYAKKEIQKRTCSTSEQKKTSVVINNILFKSLVRSNRP